MRWGATVPEWLHYLEYQLVCTQSARYIFNYVAPSESDAVGSMRHLWYYGRCLHCSAEYSAQWEGSGIVPRLSDLNPEATATWAEQIDKGSIARQPFWIHDMKPRTYTNEHGEDVAILVLHITMNGPHPKDGRAVITLGHTEERQPYLDYFESARQDGEKANPLGPVITYEVPLKAGRSFWRLEDAPEDDEMLPEMPPATGSGKKK